MEVLPIIPPAKMTVPFTTKTEIQKAAKGMKNQQSVGKDELNGEYVKYGLPEIYQNIAALLNKIVETDEIKRGIQHHY